MLEETFEGLSEKWAEFLDWSDEKGLPLRGASDALEQKGIPPAPFFLGVVIVLVIALGILFLGNPLSPQTTTVRVTVTDGQLGVAGVTVYLQGASTGSVPISNVTNANGIAIFTDMPYGDYNASMVSDSYLSDSKPLSLRADSSAKVSFQAVESASVENATLTVSVSGQGLTSATVSILDYASGNPLASQAVSGTNLGATSFSLQRKKTYTVVANAAGYSQNSTTVTLGDSTVFPLSLTLSPVSGQKTVDVTVRTYTGTNGSSNDTKVKVYLSSNGLLYRTLDVDFEGKALVTLTRGDKFRIVSSLDGYSDAAADYTADPSNDTITLRMYKPSAADLASQKISCTVTDENGKALSSAIVTLFLDSNKVTEKRSSATGDATFIVNGTDLYRVTAYAGSRIPASTSIAPGDSCTLALSPSKSNSGRVKVFIYDDSGLTISGASVSLYDETGPIGLPSQLSASDGAVIFDDVPLTTIHASASYAGRQGDSDSKVVTVDGEVGQNGTILSITLLPATGKIKVRVIDRFTRATITGATASMTTTDSASCSTVNGMCELELLEGWGQVSITAAGYATYTSSQIQVTPNVEKEQVFELLPASVASSIKVEYLGLFDLDGNKVSSLEPSTTYNARFLVNAPSVKFTRAVLHVRLGNTTGDVAAQNAYISGYDGGADVSVSGAASYASSGVLTANSTSATAQNSYDYDSSSIEYKWAEFSYKPFAGTQEVSVQITTRQVNNGTVLLGYRTAYYGSGGVLRDPSDDTAGSAKAEYLANVNTSKYSISFGGTCQDDTCLEAQVVSSRGEYSKKFEASVPEEFTLKVTSISKNGPYDIRLTMDTLKAAEIVSGTSSSGTAAITNESDGQLAVLEVPAGNSESEFTIRAIRVTDALKFNVEANYQGDTINSVSISGRILSATDNSLNVVTSPSKLTALTDNNLAFIVTDAFGTPVENAHIVLGTKNDVFGEAANNVDGTGDDGAGQNGTYIMGNVNPGKIGNAAYSVTAAGYAETDGNIPVTAKQILDISPTDTLTIMVDSKDSQSELFTLSNMLDNTVQVTATLVLDKTPKITGTLLSDETFQMDPKEIKQLKLDTWISDLVLQVAPTDRILSENFTGKVVFEARAGSSKQTVSVPISVSSSFEQKLLDDYWGVQESEADASIVLGTDNTSTTNITVFNDLDNNLLVNYQLEGGTDWLSFSPASVTLGPNSGQGTQVIYAGAEEAGLVTNPNTGTIQINARVPSGRTSFCVMENEGKIKANLTLVASIAGVRSQKKIPVVLSLESDTNCAPDNGVDVVIPVGVRMDVPTGSLYKTNSDGSVVVQVNSNRVLFASGAVSGGRTAPYVSNPADSAITVSPSLVTIVEPQKDFSMSLPSPSTYFISNYFEKSINADGSTNFTLTSGDSITFPAGSTISASTASLAGASSASLATSDSASSSASGSTGYTVKVPANQRVIFQLTGNGAACTGPLSFGVDSTFMLPSGTQVDSDQVANTRKATLSDCQQVEVDLSDGGIITLPEASEMTFPSAATISRSTLGFSASVGASQGVELGVCSQNENTYKMTFGTNMTFLFAGTADFNGLTLNLGGCQAISASGYTLPSASSLEFSDDAEIVTDDNGDTAINVPSGSLVSAKACACGVTAGTGKVSLNPGVTATTGGVLKITPNQLNFTLTDGTLKQTKEVCIQNGGNQPLNVSATSDKFGSSGIIQDSDMYFSKEYSHSGLIAPSKKTSDCSTFSITAEVPSSYMDLYGCIKDTYKKPQVVVGKVKLVASTLTGVPVSTKNLPFIDINVTVQAGKCDSRDKGITDQYLKDVFVNYDSSLKTTTGNMLLGFKDVGHDRFVTIVNNRDDPVSVAFSSEKSVVNCFDLPASIPPAGTAVVRCTSQSGTPQGAKDRLTFKFTGTGYDKSILVNAVAYSIADANGKAVYSSTAIGDMLPLSNIATAVASSSVSASSSSSSTAKVAGTAASQDYYKRYISFADASATPTGTPYATPTPSDASATPTPSATPSPTATSTTSAQSTTASNGQFGVTSAIDCSTHFCTYDQTKQAYTTFIDGLHRIVTDYLAKDDNVATRLTPICNLATVRGGAYKKSIALEIVNMNQSLDFLNSIAEEQFGVRANNLDIPTFDGCGIYTIEVGLNFCQQGFTDADSLKSGYTFDIRASKSASCKETLANSLVLMGDYAETVTGNNRTQGAAELLNPLNAVLKNGINGLAEIPGSVTLGPFKKEWNIKDQIVANELMIRAYGTTSAASPLNLWRGSNFFGNSPYCLKSSALLDTLAGGLIASDFLLAPVSDGYSLITAASAISGCVGGTAVSVSGGDDATCAAVCNCPMAAIAAQINMIPGLQAGTQTIIEEGLASAVETEGAITSAQIAAQIKQNLAVDAAFTAVGIAVNAVTGGSAGSTSAGTDLTQIGILSSHSFNGLFSNRMTAIRSLTQKGLPSSQAETAVEKLTAYSVSTAAFASPLSVSEAGSLLDNLKRSLRGYMTSTNPITTTTADGVSVNLASEAFLTDFNTFLESQAEPRQAQIMAMLRYQQNSKGTLLYPVGSDAYPLVTGVVNGKGVFSNDLDIVSRRVQTASQVLSGSDFETEAANALRYSYAQRIVNLPADSDARKYVTDRFKALSISFDQTGDLQKDTDNMLSALKEYETKSTKMEVLLGDAFKADGKISSTIKSTTFEKFIADDTKLKQLLENAASKDRLISTAENLKESRLSNKIGMGAAVLGTLALFVATDCNMKPPQAVLNPEVRNHFVVYSTNGDASTYRTCFNKASIDDSLFTPNVDSSTCVYTDTICSQGADYCLGLAKSGEVQGIQGYTLFAGFREANMTTAAKTFESVFDTTTKPSISTPVFYRQSTNSFLQSWIINLGLRLDLSSNNKFTFVNG